MVVTNFSIKITMTSIVTQEWEDITGEWEGSGWFFSNNEPVDEREWHIKEILEFDITTQ